MTRWVGLGVEMARWGVKTAGRGRGSPPNESNDSLGGCWGRQRGGGLGLGDGAGGG